MGSRRSAMGGAYPPSQPEWLALLYTLTLTLTLARTLNLTLALLHTSRGTLTVAIGLAPPLTRGGDRGTCACERVACTGAPVRLVGLVGPPWSAPQEWTAHFGRFERPALREWRPCRPLPTAH